MATNIGGVQLGELVLGAGAVDNPNPPIFAYPDPVHLAISPQDLTLSSDNIGFPLLPPVTLVTPRTPQAFGKITGTPLLTGVTVNPLTPQAFGNITALPSPFNLTVTPWQVTAFANITAFPQIAGMTVTPLTPQAFGDITGYPQLTGITVIPRQVTATGQIIAQPLLVNIPVTPQPFNPFSGGASITAGVQVLEVVPLSPEAHGDAVAVITVAEPDKATIELEIWQVESTGDDYYLWLLDQWGPLMLFSIYETNPELNRFPVYLVSDVGGDPVEGAVVRPRLSVNGMPTFEAANLLTEIPGEPGSYYLQLTPEELAQIGTIRVIIDEPGMRKFDGVASIVGWDTSPTTSEGAVPVDQDFGGEDNLQFVDENAVPIVGAEIVVYLLEDYLEGRRVNAYVKGRSKTDVHGRWIKPVMLFPADYRVVFSDRARHRTTTADIAVS